MPEGDKPSKPVAPKNYTPLQPKEREQWNNFLDFLNKQGVAGSPELDKRDQSLGLSYMDKYRKMNPDFKLQPSDVERIQYEQQLLRKGDSFPTMTPNEFNTIKTHLMNTNQKYLGMPLSEPDNWLGSLTSKEYYPQASIVGSGLNKSFGTDLESYARALLGQK
jgi:hypothetical protein